MKGLNLGIKKAVVVILSLTGVTGEATGSAPKVLDITQTDASQFALVVVVGLIAAGAFRPENE